MQEKIKAFFDALANFLPALVALACAVILLFSPTAAVSGEEITEKVLAIIKQALVAALGAWGLYLAIGNVIDKRATQAAQANEEWKLAVLEKRIQLGMVQIRMREAGLEDDRGVDTLTQIQEEIDREIDSP